MIDVLCSIARRTHLWCWSTVPKEEAEGAVRRTRFERQATPSHTKTRISRVNLSHQTDPNRRIATFVEVARKNAT